jgi:hypothetical protein
MVAEHHAVGIALERRCTAATWPLRRHPGGHEHHSFADDSV